MGPVNSKDDFYSSVMRQSEFEHWKQLGNDLAVEALQNSDTLSCGSWSGSCARLSSTIIRLHHSNYSTTTRINR